MKEPLVWTIRPAAEAVSDVRRELSRECGELPDALLDDAMLLASELVTNAVRYGGSDITLRLWPGPERIRLEVTDASADPPTVDDVGPTTERGRGLAIVQALASRWGAVPRRSAGGKTVWFELDSRAC